MNHMPAPVTPTAPVAQPAAPSPAPPPPRNSCPPLRILCLHDADSNAEEFKIKLRKLGHRLWRNHHIELVFVNAPLTATDHASHRRCWWQTTDEHPYLGLDASLLLIKQMWTSWSPFSGIIGVGQGASLGALLTLWLFEVQDETRRYVSEPQRAPPQMAIWIDGYTVLPEDAPLLSIQSLECLHILQPTDNDESNNVMMMTDDADPDMPSSSLFLSSTTTTCPSTTDLQAAKSRFVTQLGGRTHVRKVAEAWHSTDCLNLMGRYLVQGKQAHQSTAVARIQDALVATEQEAAQLVARHAMENPPSSLMAVIGPSELSGWTGPKRDLPAGGAPCPADFVLPVHMRGTQEDGNVEINSQRA